MVTGSKNKSKSNNLKISIEEFSRKLRPNGILVETMTPGYCVSSQKCCRSNLNSKPMKKKKKKGWQQHNSTQTTTSRYNFMLFYVFKMAEAIAFLCENDVETI